MENTMSDPLEVPVELYSSIPEDADEATKLYMRAQVVIQGAYYSLGDRDISPGEASLEYSELEQILAAALAMLVAGNRHLKTKRDIRLRVEEHAKYIRGFAEILKGAQDTQAIDILDMLQVRRSSTN
jgi:hypothetical protein